MKPALRIFLCFLTFILSAANITGAQDSTSFTPGNRVLILSDWLPVHTRPEATSPIAAEMPRGTESYVVAVQTDQQGETWYYLPQFAHGWVSAEQGGQPTMVLLLSERLDRIVAEASSMIASNPNATQAYVARSTAYSVLNQYDLAVTDMNTAINLSPGDARLYRQRGNVQLDAGNYEAAAQDLEQAISRGDRLARTYRNLGIAYQNMRSFSHAIEAYQNAISVTPDYGLPYTELGHTYRWQDRFEEALPLFNQAIELDPHLSRAYVDRADNYRDMGDYESALQDYNQAIVVDPYYSQAYVLRAIFYAQTYGDPTAALADFNRAVEVDPTNDQAYSERGVFYMKQGNADLAVNDLKQTIALNPNNDHARFTLGALYGYLGRYNDAIASYTEAIKPIGVYDTAALLYRPQAYIAIDDYDSALQDLNDFLGFRASDGDYFVAVAYLLRGAVYLYRGEYMLASQDYQEAFMIQNEFASAYAYYGGGYRITPLREQSIVELQGQAAAQPDNADLQLRLGHLLMEYGQWQAGLEQYRVYLKLVPDAELESFVSSMEVLMV